MKHSTSTWLSGSAYCNSVKGDVVSILDDLRDFKDELVEKLSELLLQLFEEVGADISEIKEIAKGYDVEEWSKYRAVQAGLLAAPQLVPGLNWLLVVPELLALIRFLRVSMLGVGFIKGLEVDKDDFAAIFMFASDRKSTRSLTAKALTAKARVLAAASGNAAGVIAPALGAKLVAGAVVSMSINVSGHTVGPLVARKAATFLAGILAGPTFIKIVPILGVIVGAVANGYVTSKMIDDAVAYFDMKKQVIAELSKPNKE